MTGGATPVLDPRDETRLLRDLLLRAQGYPPGPLPVPGGPAYAVTAVYARFLQSLAERLNAAPDKNKLAFLDQLGISLLPPQAARTPVIFEPLPGASAGRAPAGTRLGAKLPGSADPLPFETERPVALSSSRLTEVVTVQPGRDAYADHSADAIGGRSFRLFEGLRPVAHELYVAHDVHLALTGQSKVAVELELPQPASRELDVSWSYWDGESWRGFKAFASAPSDGESFDGTDGLRRAGTVALATDCAQAKPRTVAGREAFWLRGALAGPLPPDPSRRLPLLDRVRLRTVIDRPVAADCSGGLVPDEAFAGGEQLDLSKVFYPFGQQPGIDTVFYVRNAEVASRPGARLTVCVGRAKTPQDEADAKGAKYEVDVTRARDTVNDVRDATALIREKLQKALDEDLAPGLPALFDAGQPEAWYAEVRAQVQLARDVALLGTPAALGVVLSLVGQAAAMTLNPTPAGFFAWWPAATAGAAQAVAVDLIAAAALMTVPSSGDTSDLDAWIQQFLPQNVTNLVEQLITGTLSGQNAVETIMQDIRNRYGEGVPIFLDTDLAGTNLPKLVGDARQRYATALQRIARARTKVQEALEALDDALGHLADLTAPDAAAIGGSFPPTLTPPRLAWEYWNGRGWVTLITAAPGARPENLSSDGSFELQVPEDWEPCEVNGTEERWLRARLHEGSFYRLRLVSWFDTESQAVNYFPVFEPRAPALAVLKLGYQWRSKPDVPQACVTLNDFEWSDRTEDVRWRGAPFEPYSTVRDTTPTLYLGFDGPLPADVLGIYMGVREVEGEASGPRLVWEYWDGSAWIEVSARDETAGFALPGIVEVTWPGVDAPAPVALLGADGAAARLIGRREAARFAAGDRIWVASDDAGELATVAGVAGDTLELVTLLGGSYRGGTVALAGLARFGTPRSWLRARLRRDGAPRRAEVETLLPNATWALQALTVHDELLGSGNGEPRQALFARSVPVLPGQAFEVRELEGARATVDLPLLQRELDEAGIGRERLRTVTDRRTGRTVEAWVEWEERADFFSSGPADRHYTVERTRGRLLFGDGRRGRVLPAGANNARLRRYRSGGGERGNVPAGAISQVLSGAVVQAVSNPRAAEGGAEGERVDAVHERGPLSLRHRRQAITLADHEALAREASSAVALAKAVQADRAGRPVAGHVTVTIVPFGTDARPQPSFELRRRVERFLRARSPAGLLSGVEVRGPVYRPVGVEAVVAPAGADSAGPAIDAVRSALVEFLHPIRGGPDGRGWGFGRDVYASDIASVLERVPGVDHLERLHLLVEGSPELLQVQVPADRIVVAGPLRLTLSGAEG